jgi:hypothetical protein
VVHIHCILDKVVVLEHMVEVIRNPDMKDNPGAVENQTLAGYSRVLVDSFLPEADRQDSADMVDKQAGSEALPRDA